MPGRFCACVPVLPIWKSDAPPGAAMPIGAAGIAEAAPVAGRAAVPVDPKANEAAGVAVEGTGAPNVNVDAAGATEGAELAGALVAAPNVKPADELPVFVPGSFAIFLFEPSPPPKGLLIAVVALSPACTFSDLVASGIPVAVVAPNVKGLELSFPSSLVPVEEEAPPVKLNVGTARLLRAEPFSALSPAATVDTEIRSGPRDLASSTTLASRCFHKDTTYLSSCTKRERRSCYWIAARC